MKLLPFANYENFDDCVRHNKTKGNPQAYCGSIQAQVEGNTHKVARLLKQMSKYDRDCFFVELEAIQKGEHADFVKKHEILVEKYAAPGTAMSDPDRSTGGTTGGFGGKKGEDGFEGDQALAGAGVQTEESIEQPTLEKPTPQPQPQQPQQPQQPSDAQAMKPVIQGIDQEILGTPMPGTSNIDSEEGVQPVAGLSQPTIPQPQPKSVLLHNDQQVNMGEHIDQLHQRLTGAGYKLGNRDVKQDGSSTIDYNNDEVGHKITVHHDGNGQVDGFKENLSADKALKMAESALKGIGSVLGGISGTGSFCIVCKIAVSIFQKCPRCEKTVCRKCYNKHSRSHSAPMNKGFPYNLKFD